MLSRITCKFNYIGGFYKDLMLLKKMFYLVLKWIFFWKRNWVERGWWSRFCILITLVGMGCGAREYSSVKWGLKFFVTESNWQFWIQVNPTQLWDVRFLWNTNSLSYKTFNIIQLNFQNSIINKNVRAKWFFHIRLSSFSLYKAKGKDKLSLILIVS